MKPKAVCFDLDDTLVVFDGVTQVAWDETYARFASALGDPARVRACMDEYAAWYWSCPERHREGRSDLKSTRRRLMRTTFERLGRQDFTLADEVADYYTTHREAIMRPIAGARETLRELAESGIALALLTNGEGFRQRAKIERFELGPLFPVVLIEGEFGAGKPDRRVYQRALELLDCEPDEAWMVGDNLVWDIAGAQAAGLSAAWYDWRGQGLPRDSTIKPDCIITAIPQLLELFR